MPDLLEQPAKAEKKTKAVKRFKVHLAALTPLTINPMTVEAETGDEAWQKFCDANGISGSRHERTIEEVK